MQWKWLQLLAKGLVDVEVAYLAIKTSIFAEGPWLVFVLIFSVFRTLYFWLCANSPLWEQGLSANGLNSFGQLTALLLLLVPIFTAIEAFLGAPGNTRQAASFDSEGSEEDEGKLSPSTGHLAPGRLPVPDPSDPDFETAGNGILRRRTVRLAIYCLSLWYFLALVYAAVIAGSPWFVMNWALSAHFAVASWFV